MSAQVKQYEAFWVRGVGWTLCAADPDTEDVEIEIDLISIVDHNRDIKMLEETLQKANGLYHFYADELTKYAEIPKQATMKMLMEQISVLEIERIDWRRANAEQATAMVRQIVTITKLEDRIAELKQQKDRTEYEGILQHKIHEHEITITRLKEYLRPFVEKVPHDQDHGRPGNPVEWCRRCELDAILTKGESDELG